MNRLLLVFLLTIGVVFGGSPEKGCGNNPADIVFVLDESGSIWGPHFKQQLQFVQEIIGSFDVGFNRTHVGVLTFGTNNRVIFPLGKYTSESELKTAVASIRQQRGETYTHLALKRLREEMFSPRYARPWVRHVAIIITDGESNYPQETKKEAALCHRENYQMFAIGVGQSVVRNELEAIASANDLVFTVDSYGALESLRQILAWKACEPPTTPAPPTTTTPPPPPQMIEGCSGSKKMDHLWSISDQAGVDETNYALDFIKAVTAEMNIDPLRIQVGLTPRYCDEGNAIRLKDHDTREGFWRDLDRRRLSGVRSDRTIEYIRREGVSPQNGGRSDAVKYGILIIDNTETNWENALSQARLAKEEGIRLIVIGVGNRVSRAKLEQLAWSTEDTIIVSSYSQLNDEKSRIVQRFCEGIKQTNWKKSFLESLYDY